MTIVSEVWEEKEKRTNKKYEKVILKSCSSFTWKARKKSDVYFWNKISFFVSEVSHF